MWRNLLVLLVLLGWVAKTNAAETSSRRAAEDAVKEGNWDDALRLARMRLDSGDGERADLLTAVDCLVQLGRVDQTDELIESTLAVYPKDPEMLLAGMWAYARVPRYGHEVAGEFRRGPQRGGGPTLSTAERDRVRCLQLGVEAWRLAEDDPHLPRQILDRLRTELIADRMGGLAWRLQKLTPLDELPVPTDRWSGGLSASAPPVGPDGETPLLYEVAASWDAARNDGERWRWALAEGARRVEIDRPRLEAEYTDFLHRQFGVQSLARSGWFRQRGEGPQDETSALAVETLADDETIARLATGVRRFKLPEGHRFIERYRAAGAWGSLSEIYLNRNQRPAAVEATRRALEAEGDDKRRERIQQKLDQLTEPWVRFESTMTQPAGEGASLRATFRNAAKVELAAQAIDTTTLLADVRRLLSDPPKEWDHDALNVTQLGRRLMDQDQQKYLQEEVASWSIDLDTPPEHRDGQAPIATPLQQAGAYLVTARPIDGEGTAGAEASVVVWVAETVLVRKQAAVGVLYQLLDAVEGSPIPNATLDLFGYRMDWDDNGRTRIETKRVAETTNADGLALFEATPDAAQDERLFGPGGDRFEWLATATTAEGSQAYLGFAGVWRREVDDSRPQNTRTFVVTDRPAYRPANRVEFKAWVGKPNYAAAAVDGDEEPVPSEYAHQEFQIAIHDARGEKVDKQRLTADAFGGVAGSYEVPDGAPLGRYRLEVVGFGSGSFRVEEYRKPEFEVAVEAPTEPTTLGEPFEATIRADYYAGTPVRGGTLSYKVVRTKRTERWLPIGPWDWLYGRGYGWLGQDAGWRSDWRRWGCFAPTPPWWQGTSGPPEVVAEGEAELGPDGTYQLSIDTQTALDRQPNHDHRYEITAEVTDAGRRTIVGSGSVLAARRPVEVTVWLDRGFYDIGDTARARVSVRRPDGKPIAAGGELRLLKIALPEAEQPEPGEGEATELEDPAEKLVQSWRLASDASGTAEMRLKASEPGRYRLVYRSEAADVAIEGGLIFTIRGRGFDGRGFDFGDLELVLDKAEYAPGETARLLINTDRPEAIVSLFLRPVEGVYSTPQVLQLGGKSKVVEVPVSAEDLPNFFVEAHTVSGGRLHTATKRIVVPPESRVLEVEAAPSATTYLPGEEGSLRVRLTDALGEPVVGQATIAVYDRSVEAIAGGPSGGDIRKRFWDWTRNHSPQVAHSLQRSEYSVTARGVAAMQSLGVFGNVVPRRLGRGKAFGGGFGGAFGGGGIMLGAAVESTAGVPMMARGMVPQAAPAAMASDGFADLSVEFGEGIGGEGPSARENFADTALWIGSVETDAEGFATVPMPLPESLTSWKVRVWAVSDGLRVGQGEAEVVTRKELMVRLRATRFLIDGDEAVVSALVQNESPRDLTVNVDLRVEGDTITTSGVPSQSVRVAAGSEALVDWRLKAVAEGQAKLTAIATVLGTTEADAKLSDAMRVELPVLVHGAERVESFSAVIPPDERLTTFELVVPEERRPEATRLEVRYSPTLVGAMLDAVPYLIEFPHGCTEQTLNRFLPAAIVRKTIEDLGVDLEDLKPEEAPAGPPGRNDPVFDRAELDRIVKAGVSRLMEMQLSDGGWGWFSGWGERSTPHTTVVVVRGLGVAKRSGVAVPEDVLRRGLDWLVNYRSEQLARLANVNEKGKPIDDNRPWKRHADNLDALIELVLVESGNRDTDAMLTRLFEDRLRLAPYCRATLGLALHQRAAEPTDGPEYATLRDRVVRNLKQFVQQDDENQTAYLKLPGSGWWYWYGSEYEAQAYFLKLLAATEPNGDLAPRLVKYLLANRRHSSRWNSTRDTALVIEAMADYVRASGESTVDGTVEVWLDGKLRDTQQYDAATALRFDGRFVLEGEALSAGRHTLELRKQSAGRLYAAASLANFTLEDDIRAAGLEVRVKRRLKRLVPIESNEDDVDARGGLFGVKTKRYRRVDVPNLGAVESGDLIEVELTITSKNDYEYLILEDPKPAGFEPVETSSGYTGNALGAYVEFRDQQVVFYARTLARGERTVTYRLRAETPGRYAALPTQVRAMYAPDLRGNSDEIKVSVVDGGD